MERTYIIPLRKEFQKVPTYKKSKKATKAIKEFIMRHMKAKDFEAVKILNELNNQVWMHGIRNPPSKVHVDCKKLENGNVLVQLHGKAFPAEKKEEKKGIAAKLAEKVTGKKAEAKPSEKKDEHAGHSHEEHHAGHNHETEKKPAAKPAAPMPKPAPAKPTPAKHNQEQKR